MLKDNSSLKVLKYTVPPRNANGIAIHSQDFIKMSSACFKTFSWCGINFVQHQYLQKTQVTYNFAHMMFACACQARHLVGKQRLRRRRLDWTVDTLYMDVSLEHHQSSIWLSIQQAALAKRTDGLSSD
jgi:hypothetical protein